MSENRIERYECTVPIFDLNHDIYEYGVVIASMDLEENKQEVSKTLPFTREFLA